MAWFAETLGPMGFKEVLSSDRPFLMGIYMLTTSLLPMKPIYWQAFALLSRWLCGISVYWALIKIWPSLKKQMLWVSILFTIFPGFKQQPIAIIYANGFFLLTAFFFSLGLMIRGMETKGRSRFIFIMSSIFLQVFTIFSTEYYAGLEFLRIIIIWQKNTLTLRKFRLWFSTMLREYLPYAVGLLIFFIWRVFIFKFPTYKPITMAELSGSQYPEILVFLNRMLQDLYLASWKAWIDVFQFPNLSEMAGKGDYLYWAFVLLLIPFCFLLLRKQAKCSDITNQQSVLFSKWENQVLILAISALLLGALPYWGTNLPIQLNYPYDRFFLSLMFGSTLLLVYLIEKFIQGDQVKLLILSLVISFSIGFHLNNANTYRREWAIQNEFLWQLVWRVPAMQENTLLLAETFPLQYSSDNSLTAPLNWIYDTSDLHIPLKYMMMFTDIRLGSSLPDLSPGTRIEKNYRSTYFEGTTEQIIGYFYSTDACLRILDPQQSQDDPLLPESINEIIDVSDPSRILRASSDAAHLMDKSIFGEEPDHDWCYYYLKADLARQFKDWTTILALEEQTKQLSLKANVGSEYLPFSEAFAAQGDWENSMKYIRKAYSKDKTLEKLLCREIRRYQENFSPSQSGKELLKSEMDYLACP